MSVHLREVDADTPNACWVVCAEGDLGAVEFADGPEYGKAYRHWAFVADQRLGQINKLLRHVPRDIGMAILRGQPDPPADAADTAGDHNARARARLSPLSPLPVPVAADRAKRATDPLQARARPIPTLTHPLDDEGTGQ